MPRREYKAQAGHVAFLPRSGFRLSIGILELIEMCPAVSTTQVMDHISQWVSSLAIGVWAAVFVESRRCNSSWR